MGVDAPKVMGRPTDYCEEIAERIVELLVQGWTLKRICEQEDFPSYVSVWRWEQKHPEFRKLLRRAREGAMFFLGDECIEIADDGTGDIKTIQVRGQDTEVPDAEFAARSRLRVDTRLRIMGKLNRAVFGDKVALTGGDEDDAPIKVRRIVTELVDPTTDK